MKKFLKLIVDNSEKKAEETNMSSEEKKEYINKRLFEYFERNDMNEISDELVNTYKEVYPEFSREDFAKYVVLHTKNQDAIFNEKLRLKEKLEKIEHEIFINKRELGVGMWIREEDRPKYLFGKMKKVEEKYEINVDEKEKLTQEQIQENIELIEEMIKAYDDPEQLHQVAKGQVKYFSGMKNYQELLKEKSPEYKKYIEESLENELKSYKDMKTKIENKLVELEQLKEGFEDCITNVYDPRLDEKRRGKKVKAR